MSDGVWAAIIGAVAGLVGAIAGSALTFYFGRLRERDAFKTRWDRDRLTAFSTYLISANGAYRKLLAARRAVEKGEPDVDNSCWLAIEAFEEMHRDSETLTLLAGLRDNPVRRCAREMRAPLLPLADAARTRQAMTDEEGYRCASLFRQARDDFIVAAQVELEVPPGKSL